MDERFADPQEVLKIYFHAINNPQVVSTLFSKRVVYYEIQDPWWLKISIRKDAELMFRSDLWCEQIIGSVVDFEVVED